MLSDTIAAISTSMGGAGGIGVIRISGGKALSITGKIFKPSTNETLKSHTVRHGWIVENFRRNGSKLEWVDEVLVTYMASPKSFTGEDIIEISCHGGSFVQKQILELAIKAGARLAERGEFTKRAFLNGKVDLAQAEAIIDIIKAKTREASLLAASQLKGALTTKIEAIREDLLGILTEIEASIDFPDEIPDVDGKKMRSRISSGIKAVDNLLETSDFGVIYREGLAVAIVGKPNVGKSSLLNAMLRQERAIVDEQPGTTRDLIEETLNIKGIALRVIDTAGIRRASNKVEKLGIDRAVRAIEEADMVLLVLDISEELDNEDRELINRTKGSRRIIVLNKADKEEALKTSDIGLLREGKELTVKVSALKGEGIDRLEKAVVDTVMSNKVVAQNMDVMINLRHKQCLTRAKEMLEKCQESVENRMQADFVSIDLKAAIEALGEVTGEVVSEEIIERIFEQFCVGK